MQAPWANAMYRECAACFTAGGSPALAEQPWRGRGRWPWPSAISAATASAPGAAADAFGEILRSSAQPSPQEKRSSKTKDPFLIRTGQTAARQSRRRSRRTAQTCRKNSPAGYFFDRLSCSAATCSSAIQIWKAGAGSGPNPRPASLRSGNDPKRSPSLTKRISRRTWHTPNPRWPVRKGAAQPARPIPSLPHLLPVREHLLHIDRGPAQRLLLEMRVDVRGGLVVGVAHDLHGDQRVDAALVEQRHVIVPEVVLGQNKIVFAQA